MYSKEKDKLTKYKQSFDDIKIPEKLDDHIQAGFVKAKQDEDNKRKLPFKWLLSVALVAIVLVGFASTKYILDLVNDDKGLIGAIEHDYYMVIGAFQKINEVEFVVDGVIADEYGMVIFYTIHSDVKNSEMNLSDIEFDFDQEGVGNLISYSPANTINRKKGRAFSGVVEVFNTTPKKPKTVAVEAKISGSIPDGNVEHFFQETFNISFTVPKDILTEKTYDLHETVTIEGQKMTFTKAVVSPLRVKIYVEMDPYNTKKILNFDDMYIVDEKGERWGEFTGSTVEPLLPENEKIIHLQSNYFSEPEELNLVFSKVQAVDKDEQFIVVDPVKEKIIKQPKGNELIDVKISMDYLMFTTKESVISHNYPIGLGSVYDEDGKQIESNSMYNSENEIGINLLDLGNQTGTISVEIYSYPSWIYGDEKIRIK